MSSTSYIRSEPALLNTEDPLFKPGRNCWRVNQADSLAVIVDAANYYRALYEAIGKAEKSIFVLGWDIDSRIRLLRGADAGVENTHTSFFDLIKTKAERNPDLQIYLNRWDYTFYQAGEREGLSLLRWKLSAPDNVHFHLDNRHPVGACHHQKIVVIDDEIAFVGGMDIAIARWDRRSHHPDNRHRVDPGGTYSPHTRMKFRPHHDIMSVLSGPAVCDIGSLARRRWKAATGEDPVAFAGEGGKARCWPESIPAQFSRIDVAIARTMPPLPGEAMINEVERLYIDQISRAEHFIYMENQYFTSEEIAVALNRQLHAKPGLRVLLVSCWEPQGIMERKAMWGGRVRFHDRLIQGGVGDRVAMAYPMSREHGGEDAVRIHSKLTIIDDSILRVGSSNLNNRSMRLDSECDLALQGRTPEERARIAEIRNDLIREHTGMSVARIAQLVESGKAEQFLTYHSESRQHLRKIDDEIYRDQPFMDWAMRLGDPKKPFFKQAITGNAEARKSSGGRGAALTVVVILLAVLLSILWKATPLAQDANPARIADFLQQLRHSVWAIPAILGVYVLATALMFPLTFLVLATALTFPPAQAFPVALAGMLCSACCGYGVGRAVGMGFFAGRIMNKIKNYIKNGGVAGITVLRMVPVAPLGLVDFSLGAARVPFAVYIAGTLLGLLPGITVFTFLGHSLSHLWRSRDLQSLLTVACGILAWISIVGLSHYLVKRWRAKPAA